MVKTYEIGDKVEIVKSPNKNHDPEAFLLNAIYEDYIGKKGTIKSKRGKFAYIVEFSKGDCCLFFIDMLKHVEKIDRIVVTKKGDEIKVVVNDENEFIAENEDKTFLNNLFDKTPKVEQNKSYLYHYKTKHKYGFIGEETPLVALFGQKLHVGDVVSCYNAKEKTIKNRLVAKKDDTYFVMGYRGLSENMKNGVDEENNQYQKVKSFEDLQHNEIYENLMVFKEKNK